MVQAGTFSGNGDGSVTIASALGFGNFPFVEILSRTGSPLLAPVIALNDDFLLPEKSNSEHLGYET